MPGLGTPSHGTTRPFVVSITPTMQSALIMAARHELSSSVSAAVHHIILVSGGGDKSIAMVRRLPAFVIVSRVPRNRADALSAVEVRGKRNPRLLALLAAVTNSSIAHNTATCTLSDRRRQRQSGNRAARSSYMQRREN